MVPLSILFSLTTLLQAENNHRMLSIPLLFEENRGQARNAAFVLSTANSGILFGDGIAYRTGAGQYRVDFIGANKVQPAGEQRHAARVNCYRGPIRTENIPAYQSLRYRRLYDGIDLVYHGRAGELEYDFLVAPGADPRRIAMRFHGPGRLQLSPQGDLIVSTGGETMLHKRPIAYQDINGKRKLIPAYFQKRGDTISFAVAPYNRRYPLTIDPILKFFTVLQGSITGLAADTAGFTYLAGAVTSPAQSYSADQDVQFLKLDPSGKLVYKTVVGGFGNEAAAGIAVDSQGNLLAAGTSNSSNYPVSGAACSGLANDAFITRISPTGALLASRCYGGTYADSAVGMGIDNAGAVYIAGNTESFDLPTTAPALQTQKRRPNASSGFIAKFDNASLALVYSTYFGNYADINMQAIAVDPTGAVVIAGRTSPQGYPLTPGAYYTGAGSTSQYSNAIFVARINPAGNSLIYSTFLPWGNGSETIFLGVDETGQAIILIPTFAYYNGSYPFKILRLAPLGTTSTLDQTLPYASQPSGLFVDRQGNMLIGVGSGNGTIALSPDSLLAPSGQFSYSSSILVKLDPAANVQFATALPSRTRLMVLSGNEIVAASEQQYSGWMLPVSTGAYTDVPPQSFSTNSSAVYRFASPSGCTPELQPGTSFTIPVSGASGAWQVRAPDNCSWVASVAQSPYSGWLQLSSGQSGTGNGTIGYSAPSLPSTEAGRIATLFLSNAKSYEFQQGQVPACQPPQVPTGVISAAAGGGLISVGINLAEGCPWTIAPSTGWTRLLTPSSGKGTATAYLDVLPNNGPARTTTISVSGRNAIVNQEACFYSLSINSPVSPFAQTLSGSVNASSGCNWTVTSNVSWMKAEIVPGTVLGGATSLSVSVEQNPSTAARLAILTVGSQNFPVTQQGLTCPLTASTTSPAFPSSGGNGAVQLVSSAGCQAYASFNSTATVSSPTVIGQGSVTFVVPPNTTAVPRGFLARTYVNSQFSNPTTTLPFIQDGVNVPQHFTDVPSTNTFFNHIAILKDRNVTRGCTFDGQRYCPSDVVTRADMASFLMRAMGLSTSVSPNSSLPIPYFDDVPPSHPAFLAIQAIRAAGVTLGCTAIPSNYCPDAQLTRGQMAALIVRAKLQGENFAYNSTPYFTDVPPTHTFFRHIQKLRELGVTLGCTATTFCPDAPNTRGEMAAFIVRAFLSGQ